MQQRRGQEQQQQQQQQQQHNNNNNNNNNNNPNSHSGFPLGLAFVRCGGRGIVDTPCTVFAPFVACVFCVSGGLADAVPRRSGAASATWLSACECCCSFFFRGFCCFCCAPSAGCALPKGLRWAPQALGACSPRCCSSLSYPCLRRRRHRRRCCCRRRRHRRRAAPSYILVLLLLVMLLLFW